MAMALLLLGAGALILYAGAELAVRGASSMAGAVGVPAFAIGAVLFGIHAGGVGAAVTAAARGETTIAAGQVFGTVLFLFAAAFGLALLLAREPIPAPSAQLVAAPGVGVVLAALAIADRLVTRGEGALLLLAYAGYVMLVLRERRRSIEEEDGPAAREVEKLVGEPAEASPEDGGLRRLPRQAVVTVIGIGLVWAGAWLLVGGGIRLVALAGLAAGFVGAAIIGALTGLDEVLLEVLPVRRGVPELATGNLFGTLAAFTTGVLGIAAVVRPLTLDAAANLAFLGVAVLYAVVGTVLLVRGRAGRALGAVVLTGYVAWVVLVSGV